MQPTITQIPHVRSLRVPHVRDGLIVANVGMVTNKIACINPVALTNSNQAAPPLQETR
jgi:hypothetical protein